MIQSVNNAMRLLDEIRIKGKINVKQAVDILGQNRSNVYRLLKTMADDGYLFVEHNNYYPGYKLDLLADMDISPIKMKIIAEPIMKSVAYNAGEIVHLCTRIQSGMLSVHQVFSTNDIQYVRRLGSVEPFFCTASGRSVLAYLPEEYQRFLLESAELKKYTLHTNTDINDLIKILKTVKEQGFAEEVSEFHEGVQCVSVPIFSGKNWPRYAIGVSFACQKGYTEQKMRIVAILKVAARQILEACENSEKEILDEKGQLDYII